MDPGNHLNEISEDKSRVAIEIVKVEDIKLSPSQTLSSHLNNVPTNISETYSPITGDNLGYPLNMVITDYNKCVKQEYVDAEETNIKEEIFEDDENVWTQGNSALDIKTEKLGMLVPRILSIKSESTVWNSENKVSYMCRFCEYETESKNSMIEHVGIHCSNDGDYMVEYEKLQPHSAQFICNDCNYTSLQKTRFIRHIKSHARKKVYGYKTKKTESFSWHMTTRTKKTPLCTSDVSTSIKNEKNNIQLPYACAQCNFRSIKKIHLLNHIKTHAPDRSKLFMCLTCGHKCNKQSYLVYHHKSEPGAKPYECKHCNYKTCIKYYFNMHSKRHTGKLPFACQYCEYKCSQLSHLMRHKRTHTGEKPFACPYCDYRCNDKSHLTAHHMKHTGEKPYKCDYCDYRSITKANLLNHIRKHTGEKPYACHQCEYRGMTRGKLTAHIRKHSGKKMYSCNQCEYTTCEKSCLDGHINQHKLDEERKIKALRTYSRTNVDKKPFACNYCDFKCLYAFSLAHHEKIHADVKAVNV